MYKKTNTLFKSTVDVVNTMMCTRQDKTMINIHKEQ